MAPMTDETQDTGIQEQPDQGSQDPSNYVSLAAHQAAGAVSPLNLSQFYHDKVAPTLNKGLDLITPSPTTQRNVGDVIQNIAMRLEAAGAVGQGRQPLWVQMREQQMKQQELNETMGLRRQQAALQVQQFQEQQRQHNWGVAEKLISTGNMDALQEFSKSFPEVLPIVQGVSKQHLSTLPTLVQEGYLPEEFVQRVMNPGNTPVSPGELSTHVKMAMDNWQADLKETAKTKQLAVALNTPKEQRKPYQQLMVDEHQKKLDVQQADIELKNSQAKKAQQEAKEGPPDHSEDNRIHQAMTGLPWAQGTQQTRRAALDLKSKLYPQGKQAVTEEIPVGQTGKAQEYRDPVTGQAAPSWATPKQLSELGFVNIEQKQIEAVNGMTKVEDALKEILAAGSSLVRKDSGGGSLMEIPRGLLQVPVVSLIKKYAGNTDAEVLDSAIKRISPTLSKLSGDTGNIALAEQKLYADSIFKESDTLESLQAKVRSIERAQYKSRQSMGFVPDEKAYLRRLVIQGKTDEQIKAIMAERKRYQ